MVNPQPLRHRLHRLTRPVGEQPTHVQLALGPLIAASNRSLQHLRGELDQPGPNPRQLVSFHPTKSASSLDQVTQRHTPT
jgi:hypothetical protein